MVPNEPESLAALNRVLVALGGEQLDGWPLGVPGDPEDCPVARPIRALCPTATVRARSITVPRRLAPTVARALGVPVPWWKMVFASVRVPNPRYLKKTIKMFDELELTDLIDRSVWHVCHHVAEF